MADTFTCECCGQTFSKDRTNWSEEQARAEASANFPDMDQDNPDEVGVVCDDCYREIMAWADPNRPPQGGR